MARPSKLTPDQWREIERRHAGGEGVSVLAKAFNISPASVSVRVSKVSETIRNAAFKLADAQTTLAALPVAQQYTAISLAEKMRSISNSLASAAELGAKTAHRLHALANAEVNKVDDAAPLDNVEALKGVSALTRLANDSSALALGMMTRSPMPQIEDPQPITLDVTKLSSQARQELLRLKNAAD
jgi:hypothetical protein